MLQRFTDAWKCLRGKNPVRAPSVAEELKHMVESYASLVETLQEELEWYRYKVHSMVESTMNTFTEGHGEVEETPASLRERVIPGIIPPSVKKGILRRRDASRARELRRERAAILGARNSNKNDDADGTEIPGEEIPTEARILDVTVPDGY